MQVRASIDGGSGYVGGELLRLLLDHPHVELSQVVSRSRAGKYVHTVHPNLRGRTRLQFAAREALDRCDVLFLARPHGEAAAEIDTYTGCADRVIDLSADFRLRSPEAYVRWYGAPHPSPGWLSRFVYGLPELHRDALRTARYASGVGCNATAAILALLPLARRGLIARTVIDVKVGSSEGGAEHSLATHHPERSGAVRSFAPTGHRHAAEIGQELGGFEIHMSGTAIDSVRGVLCTAHVFPREPLDTRSVWSLYRGAYRDEPFVRIVKEATGVYRLPEPKILTGSNYADVGFDVEADATRIVAISALDNLMKNTAGTAVQTMNAMLGFDERAGLGFAGLHPV